MRTRKSQKSEAISRAIDDISPIKSRLFDVYNNLMRAGCTREAASIDAVIGRLEGWQARNK